MFGLNGQSFIDNLRGHFNIHYKKEPSLLSKITDVSKTIDTIIESNADIVGICEVLQGQEIKLKKGLKEQGYDFFYLGKGHKTKKSKLRVQSLVASKMEGDFNPENSFPVKDSLGGGGGLVHITYKDPKFHLIFTHLGLPSKNIYLEQMNFLNGYLHNLKGDLVLLGDFNKTFKELEREEYFRVNDLASEEIKTCSTTPVLKWFYNKDVDHIFIRGFEKENAGVLSGYSDHKLLYVDFKV